MDYIVNGNQQFIVEARKRKKQPLLKKEVIGFYSKALRKKNIKGDIK